MKKKTTEWMFLSFSRYLPVFFFIQSIYLYYHYIWACLNEFVLPNVCMHMNMSCLHNSIFLVYICNIIVILFCHVFWRSLLFFRFFFLILFFFCPFDRTYTFGFFLLRREIDNYNLFSFFSFSSLSLLINKKQQRRKREEERGREKECVNVLDRAYEEKYCM